MTEYVVLALAVASQAATVFIALRALKAQREANDAALSLARETLIAARAVVPVEDVAKDADRHEALRAEIQRRRWEAEMEHKKELTRANKLYFGDEEVDAPQPEAK
jgi:hypothetical protein